MRLIGLARVGVLSLICVTAAADPARGQQLPPDARFAYVWSSQGTVLSGTYAATSGSFSLDVSLVQTAGSTDVLTAEGGLFSTGVRATYGSPSGTPGVIAVASTAGITSNPQFNDPAVFNSSTLQANGNYAQFTAATDFSHGVTPVGGRVYLGTFTFQVTGQAGQSTVLTADTRASATGNPNLTDIVTYTNLFPLDPVTSPATLNVVVVPVPEPSGLLAVGAIAAAAGWGLRRRPAIVGPAFRTAG